MQANLKKKILVGLVVVLMAGKLIFAREVFNYKVRVLSLPVLNLKMKIDSIDRNGKKLEKVEFNANTNNFFDKI